MRIWVFFVISLALLWLGIILGRVIQRARARMVEQESKFITVLEGALLTLFGLLMGFTFSMAVSRYDQRKVLAVSEANGIGTTWLRTAILAEPVRTQEQSLLREYVQARLQFHAASHSPQELSQLRERIDTLQGRMWAIASSYATDHRDPVTALYLQALNQTIDVSEERNAADTNRIPAEAWVMLLLVGGVSTIVVGMKVGSHSTLLQLILPLVLAGTLAMTMDLDTPQLGLIKVGQISMDKVAQDMQRLPQQMP